MGTRDHVLLADIFSRVDLDAVMGVNLAHLRRAAGFSQADLASGLATYSLTSSAWDLPATVSTAEGGRRAFRVADVLGLAAYFAVPAWLLITTPGRTAPVMLPGADMLDAAAVASFAAGAGGVLRPVDVEPLDDGPDDPPHGEGTSVEAPAPEEPQDADRSRPWLAYLREGRSLGESYRQAREDVVRRQETAQRSLGPTILLPSPVPRLRVRLQPFATLVPVPGDHARPLTARDELEQRMFRDLIRRGQARQVAPRRAERGT